LGGDDGQSLGVAACLVAEQVEVKQYSRRLKRLRFKEAGEQSLASFLLRSAGQLTRLEDLQNEV
jgi:hypothetical protein